MELKSTYNRKPAEAANSDGSLATTLCKYQQESGKSIYELSNTSGVDAAYIWRIMRGERQQVSREILIRISIALVVDSRNSERMVEVANNLLDAAGFKRLK